MKPIIFNTEMVKAILKGRKVQTRRPVKPLKLDQYYVSNRTMVLANPKEDTIDNERKNEKKCPLDIGQMLYVRETWTKLNMVIDGQYYLYKSSCYDAVNTNIKWKPSIHMPKEAARLFLEITDVRVERVQDISEEDAIKEGIKFLHRDKYNRQDFYGLNEKENNIKAPNAYTAFLNLWNSIYNNWNDNPFVWVYDFKRVEK